MKIRLIILAAIVVAVVATILVVMIRREDGAEDVIEVSGNIEVDDVALSFRIGGWVESRPVDEGQSVEKGALVASLDKRTLEERVRAQQGQLNQAQAALAELRAGSRPEEISAAKAAMDRAAANLRDLEAGSRPAEIAAAQAAVREAQAQHEFRQKDLERAQQAFQAQAATEQELDLARTALRAAKAGLEQAQEQLSLVEEGPRAQQIESTRQALAEARQRYELVRQGPRVEQIEQAAAVVEQAQANLNQAKVELSYAQLHSPVTGVVLSKNIEAGEYVTAGTPVVTVADLQMVFLRAYVNQTDLGKVKLGQAVRVRTDTYPDKIYEGRVVFLAQEAEFTPKNVQTEKERVKLVYRVKIDVGNLHLELKPGMPADGEILINTQP